MFGCKHKWEEASRMFTPLPQLTKINYASDQLFRELSFGVTNIEMRCTLCGQLEHYSVIGKINANN